MPASKFVAAVTIVLTAAIWSHGSAAQEERVSGNMSGLPQVQGGWVIELGHDGEQAQGDGEAGTELPAADQAQATAPLHHSGGTGIEMIVGGQGNGGVARKETLPIVD